MGVGAQEAPARSRFPLIWAAPADIEALRARQSGLLRAGWGLGHPKPGQIRGSGRRARGRSQARRTVRAGMESRVPSRYPNTCQVMASTNATRWLHARSRFDRRRAGRPVMPQPACERLAGISDLLDRAVPRGLPVGRRQAGEQH